MIVLSLFDGMSCGRIALDRANINVKKYYASEIDKFAIKVSEANYPDIIRLGDVNNWREWDIDWGEIDLIIAGSPCQGFSFAGKQLAFDDPRSKLFFVFVDILNHIKLYNKDIKFLLENVRMKKEFQDIISESLGVEPVVINSSLVSAQNRNRYYWANFKISQPEDKGIMIQDIIEEKCYPIPHNLDEGIKSGLVKTDNMLVGSSQSLKRALRNGRGPCDKGRTLTAVSSGSQAGNGCTNILVSDDVKCGAFRGRYIVNGKRQDHKIKTAGLTTQRLEVREDNKSNCLTTVQKDNVLTINGAYFRKLTPLECERLQTVPDNYTNHVSNSQRYKMLGNGWTVDVIAHIFRCLVGEE